MPRDGSGIYTTPVGTTAVPDTTIESAKYNANVNDVAADLNAPRPIIAGGTGANNAIDAAINLGVVSGKTAIVYTDAEKAVARNNIYAAPLDALAYNGMQINGSLDVSQETGFGSLVGGGDVFVCDGWKLNNSTGAVIVAACHNSGGPPGITNRLELNVTAAATPTGTQLAQVYQTIEGYRVARLGFGIAGAQPITIGFWTGHGIAGIYSVSVRNSADNRSYVFSYTQNTGSVWEYKTATIPGDVTGTWLVNNLAGLRISFIVSCGPTVMAPAANTWYGTIYVGAPGQINGTANTSQAFRISGVTVLPGTQAPTAAQSPLIMRSADQELVLCQRYFEQGNVTQRSNGTATTGSGFFLPWLIVKRVAPTMTFVGTSYIYGCSNLGSIPSATGMEIMVDATGIYAFSTVYRADARL